MAQGQRFPSSGHERWRKNLEDLPHLTEDDLSHFCSSATPSMRQQKKAYSFAVEAYAVPSSLATNICDSRFDIVYARATCFRSQKKTGKPYHVLLAFRHTTGAITDATCECPAGASSSCSHILAVLRMIILLKKQGFKEAPAELTCTELPQQWRRPRRQGIRAMNVQNIDWRSPRENGVPVPYPLRLSNAPAQKGDVQQNLNALHALGKTLDDLGSHDFAMVFLAAKRPFVETKRGPAPPGSPLAYQQAKLPSGFRTWLSDNIFLGSGRVTVVPDLHLFDEVADCKFPDTLCSEELNILKELQLSPEEARDLEKNSRQQTHSARWREARVARLTASRFGRVIKRREEWTDKGIANIVESKDLSRVRAVQYGLRNESLAADRYSAVMQSYGHSVSLLHSGLAVNPEFPWLGASPDRFVFDPEEDTFGLLEIKCPYSLKDSQPEEAMIKSSCLTFGENGQPNLKREHDYYTQVLGQMAVAGCLWADFVVCSENWIAVERIWFDKEEWLQMRSKLDAFFFSHMLPYIRTRHQCH